MKIIVSILALVMASWFCANGTPQPPVSPAAPTPTVAFGLIPTGTDLPTTAVTAIFQGSGSTPIPGKTLTNEEAFSFQELIHYFEGGGGGGCAPYNRPIPLVDRDLGGGYPNPQDFTACPVGFPRGELVRLAIIDPQGGETSWMEVRVPSQQLEGSDSLSFTLIDLPGFSTVALQSPDWRLRVYYSGGAIDGPLYPMDANGWWSTEEKVITHSRFQPGAPVNPLDPALRTPYRTGETVYLQGIHYSPDSQVRLGLYQGVYEMKFIRSFEAETDAQGRFETSLAVNAGYEDDVYAIISADMFDPEDPGSITSGRMATFQIRNHLPYRTCQDAPLSNLVIGDRAVMVDTIANNMRYFPGEGDFSPVIGKIQPGEKVLVLGGPQCGSGLTWWLVLNEASRLVGWTAEGDQNGVWLAPIP